MPEDLLQNLTEREREEVLKILKDVSKGDTSSLNDLRYQDYSEMPVDIITFIKDPRYLGRAWHTSEGTCKLFPFWEEQLKKIFPDPFTTNYNNFIESGARGLGKSEIAVTCGLYLMHRAMCLKHPLEYFNLKPTEKLVFAFMNITEILAMDIGISKFQSTVKLSPWFMERGTITGRGELMWNPPDYINIVIGSQPRHVIGQPILFGFFDEISFIPNQDIEKLKEKAKDMIATAIGGMKTRFMDHGKSPALLVLASSKRSDKSFLEEYMKKKAQTEGENTFIVDEPVWNVRPASEYSGTRFHVGQGNRYLSSEILPDDSPQTIDEFTRKGYKVISVPIEFKSDFVEDIDRALCDFAGVSSSELVKYISAQRYQSAVVPGLSNPFKKSEIVVGNAPDDTALYCDFFDLSKVPQDMKHKPLFIHLDMSISGDATGIAGVWVKGKKPGIENNAKELYYQLAFNVSIKAPKGYQVSFAKNREFIYWLKSQGFNIQGVSTDTFQNASLGQDLIASGYNYSIISVDRVNTDKICEPYAYMKNTIYEKRILLYDDVILAEEFLQLERNSNSGKVDHPDGGRKDAADSVAGATWDASKHAEEINFYYGEDLDNTLESNSNDYEQDYKQQVMLDFENELKKVAKSPFIDFGMGPAKELVSDVYFLDNGIIL